MLIGLHFRLYEISFRAISRVGDLVKSRIKGEFQFHRNRLPRFLETEQHYSAADRFQAGSHFSANLRHTEIQEQGKNDFSAFRQMQVDQPEKFHFLVSARWEKFLSWSLDFFCRTPNSFWQGFFFECLRQRIGQQNFGEGQSKSERLDDRRNGSDRDAAIAFFYLRQRAQSDACSLCQRLLGETTLQPGEPDVATKRYQRLFYCNRWSHTSIIRIVSLFKTYYYVN